LETLTVLKFFRKYNKWILGVGGSLLMIVFLIQPVMSMFQADPLKVSLGSIQGGELTRGDVMAAASDLEVLRRFGLFLDIDPDAMNTNDDPLRFALILKDAQNLGLSASLREVTQLQLQVGQSQADLELIASRMNTTPSYIRQTIRHWLIVQQYKELMAAQTHLAGQNRAMLFRGALRDPQRYRDYEAMAYGTSLLSKPLVEHFLQDQGARVSGQVVVVQADQFLSEAAMPTGDEVRSLYEQFKDALPGRGEPYGFGYRVPDRVKIEYLSISMDEAKRKIKISEADALGHYRQYPERFGGTPASDDQQAVEPKPYNEVRDEVIENLTGQRAFELVEKMAKSAYGYLYEDTRGMAKQDDYRVVDDVSALTSMRRVAERLEMDYGLLPKLYASDGSWVNAEALTGLAGIGQSRLADNTRVDFTSFVLSAKELEPSRDNPLLPRRLQVGLAGSPLIGPDLSRYIFRLTDAQSTHLPESLDAVRDQVTEDALLLNAYKKLAAESQAWLEQAVDGGLEAVAARANTSAVPIPPSPRRVPLANGLLTVPAIPGVGQSEAFVEAFFDTANQAQESGKIADVAAELSTGAVGLESKLALAVYKIDSYKPLTREEYNNYANNPLLPTMIDTTILSPARADNPLSLKSLTYRLNYNSERDSDSDEEVADPQAEGEESS
jgi:hypothetical protein